MLTLPSSVRILIATEPADMRKGVDGLCRLVEAEFGGDIYGGTLFVFVSKQRDKLKVLTWDAGGFVVYYKRLEAGRFKMPRMAAGARASTKHVPDPRSTARGTRVRHQSQEVDLNVFRAVRALITRWVWVEMDFRAMTRCCMLASRA